MTVLSKKSKDYIVASAVIGGHRKAFISATAALTAVKAMFTKDANGHGLPDSFPVVANGVGSVDVSSPDSIPPLADWPEAYRDEANYFVTVTFLGIRGMTDPADSTKVTDGVRGLVIATLPKVEAILAAQDGDKFIEKVVEKEIALVALRGLRGVSIDSSIDQLAAAALTMPVTAADYLETNSGPDVDTESFDKLWKDFRKMLADHPSTAALVPGLPQKNEVIKSIRSKAYATENYAALEQNGIFMVIAKLMGAVMDQLNTAAIAEGKEAQFDKGDIESWVAGRETKVFETRKPVAIDMAKVDFGGFFQSLAGGTE